MTLYEELGGEQALRQIINRFIDRCFDDVMIGFLFRNARRERVKAKEYEFAAAHLGAPVTYTGRELRAVHAPHPIMGGHFMRRLQLLKDTLKEAGAPPAVVEHWVEHTLSLQAQVTPNLGGRCAPEELA